MKEEKPRKTRNTRKKRNKMRQNHCKTILPGLVFIVNLLIMTCVTGCKPITLATSIPRPSPTANIRATFIPSMDAFQLNNQCPHICWQGIHPGTTSGDEALRLIKASDQFDQQRTRREDAAIVAYWFTEKTKDYKAHIYIELANSIVKSITISHLEPYTVNDLVGLFGEPEGIRFVIGKYPYEGGIYTIYQIYYTSLKASLLVQNPGVHNPQPGAFVDILYLGYESEDPTIKPWSGFKSLEEYFPKGTPTTKPPNPFE